jgi:hypothetical protein
VRLASQILEGAPLAISLEAGDAAASTSPSRGGIAGLPAESMLAAGRETSRHSPNASQMAGR